MFERIFPNLFVLYPPGPSSNAYLLVGKKNIIVDTGLKENSPLLEDAMKAIGLAPNDIDLVLITHGHADHFGGAGIFKKAEVAMHHHDAEFVNMHDEIFTASAFFGNKYFPKVTAKLNGTETIGAKPFSLRVIPTPGHTKGSISLYDQKHKFLISGDTLFINGIGRYDLPSSSKRDLTASLAKISGLDFHTLMPGHGLASRDFGPETALSFI